MTGNCPHCGHPSHEGLQCGYALTKDFYYGTPHMILGTEIVGTCDCFPTRDG